MCHYSETELEKYRNHKMTLISRVFCFLHLRHCKKCSGMIDDLNKDDFLIQDIRNQMKNEQVSDNEKTYQSLCDHFHATTGSTI